MMDAMPARDPSEPNLSSERMVALELLVTHLQRDFEMLNAGLIDQQKQLDALRRLLERLSERLVPADDSAAARSPEDETPPHY